MFAKADKLKGKKQAVLEVIERCKICSELKKAPPRPKVGMPNANDFNEVVGLDFKVLDKNKGYYILWMVDLFTKLIKGKFITDKKPATIIEAIISTWIVGDGSGPGHPSRGFWSDNGGEFLNEELLDFAASFDITIKMTAADAPWQNGVVERHHATADIIFEKMLLEDPKMNPQEAINHAAFSKNAEINNTRFSALQLVCGQSPKFPGLSDVSPVSSNLKSTNKYMKALKNIDKNRVRFREIDCDTRIKKALGEKMNLNVEKAYNLGDPVFFYDQKRKEWKRGTALVRLGKTLYLRFGNFLRRVPVEMVRPDLLGETIQEEGYLEPNDDEERFKNEEEVVEDMAQDLDLAEKNKELVEKLTEAEKQVSKLEQELKSSKEGDSNVELQNNSKKNIEEEATEKAERRKEKRKLQKEKKEKEKLNLPVTGQNIIFKEKASNKWRRGRIVASYKKNSKYRNWRHILVDNVIIEKDFGEDIEEWKDEANKENHDEDTEKDEFEFDHDSMFPVKVISSKEYGQPEVQEAMQAEIAKYKTFNAFEEVDDDGQPSIPIRWVVTEQKDDGKNQPYKARMCVRGDLERGKENIRSDSPTAAKESLKIALTIAANEGFKIQSIDIKSAFLQGCILEREVFVKPPKEADSEGKLWKLLQGAYGISDGGRLFYLKFAAELSELGMHKIHSDEAFFTYNKNGKLHGLIVSHVDDWFVAGDEVFEKDVIAKLNKKFKFSKIQKDSFNYLGCKIEMKSDGGIELDQNEYTDALERIGNVEGEDDNELSEKEKKVLRGKIGELLWLSLMTRPDLSFEVNLLSAEVSKATLKTARAIEKLIKKAKNSKNTLRFVKLGDVSKLNIKVYADASFNNRDDKTRSTEGRIILLENPEEGLVNVVNWKTKKIPRVCRSVKGAETRALEDAVDDAINIARLVKEVYDGEVVLKDPKQIPVIAMTDSKSLWESVHNTRQCDEKLLRNSIAGIKELMDLKMIKSIDWVETKMQLADCLTKQGKGADWLLKVSATNKIIEN